MRHHGAQICRIHLAATLVIVGFIYPFFEGIASNQAFGIQAWLKAVFGQELHDFAGSVVVHAMGGWLGFNVISAQTLDKFSGLGGVAGIFGQKALGGASTAKKNSTVPICPSKKAPRRLNASRTGSEAVLVRNKVCRALRKLEKRPGISMGLFFAGKVAVDAYKELCADWL